MQIITPSKHDPWAGGIEHAFTRAQSVKAEAMKRKTEISTRLHGTPEDYTVTMRAAPRAGDDHMPHYVRILCPVIGARKDKTKICVIAPDGTDQWVAWK